MVIVMSAKELNYQMNRDVLARVDGHQQTLAYLSPVPAATRRDFENLSKGGSPATVVAHHSTETVPFAPEPSYYQYAQQIDNGSVLRAAHKPLSKCIKDTPYLPTSRSDLYVNHSEPPTHSSPAYGYTSADIRGIGSNIEERLPMTKHFNNNTRYQTKLL